MTSPDKAQELLQKYSLEALGESLLAYVTKARAALGPPLLKVSLGCTDHSNTAWLLPQAQLLAMGHLIDLTFRNSHDNFVQVLESDVATGRYMPYMTSSGEHLPIFIFSLASHPLTASCLSICCASLIAPRLPL